jgi:hypothetical protein
VRKTTLAGALAAPVAAAGAALARIGGPQCARRVTTAGIPNDLHRP